MTELAHVRVTRGGWTYDVEIDPDVCELAFAAEVRERPDDDEKWTIAEPTGRETANINISGWVVKRTRVSASAIQDMADGATDAMLRGYRGET